MSGYLCMPSEDDRTTYIGSHMLDELKNEMANTSQITEPLQETNDTGSLNRDRFPAMLLESIYSQEEVRVYDTKVNQRRRNHASFNPSYASFATPDHQLKSNKLVSPAVRGMQSEVRIMGKSKARTSM